MGKFDASALDRRTFLAGAGALAASVAATGVITGCSNDIEEDPKKDPIESYEPESEPEGVWKTGGCNYDCGGRCLNKCYVVDGVVIRQKTDDTHEDSVDFPQQRGCARGRAQRAQVYAADKLKYPMKRKHYSFGGGDKSLRGSDDWERISWDEAISIIAKELKSAKENYGCQSILFPSFFKDPQVAIANVLEEFGGFISPWSFTSFGAWMGTPFIGLDPWITPVNDRYDFCNTETFILFGMNPAWSSPGNSFWYFEQAKAAGAQFYFIDPFYTESCATLGGKWIPCRPGTDSALMFAMAYVLITEDNDGSLIDWDFLRTYSVGFDETMMPAGVGADPAHNFKAYVLGNIDGVAKTPEWASEICGASVAQIKELAYACDKNKKVAILSGMANGRTSAANALPQCILALGCMTGHLGKSGHSTGVTCHRININGGAFLYTVGSTGLPSYSASLFDDGSSTSTLRATKIKNSVHQGEMWKAILEGKAFDNGTGGGFGPNTMAEWDIHVYAGFMGNAIDTVPGGDQAIEAIKKLDFVFTVNQYAYSNCCYSDVVLPVVSFWESCGLISGLGTRDAIIVAENVIEPLYEALPTQTIAEKLSDALGLDTEGLFPFSEEQGYFNVIASTTVTEPDGSTMPLATISQKQIYDRGVTGTPQTGKIDIDELCEKGVYQFDLKNNRGYDYVAYKAFVDDPVANPLGTMSGKWELYSFLYSLMVNELGWSQVDPLPMYEDGPEGYKETFSDWENKVKGEYPLQLMSVHYPGHAHTNFSNNAWVQEAFPAAIYINSSDAAAAGISEGDAVLVESKHGKLVRTAHVTGRMMAGVIALPHGCWKRKDANGIDIGGNENSISGTPITGFGNEAYNSVLVKISKYGSTLTPDCEASRVVLVQE